VTRITAGGDYGWPRVTAIINSIRGWRAAFCATTLAPTWSYRPHRPPLGSLLFPAQLPADIRAIFVALHGLDRSVRGH